MAKTLKIKKKGCMDKSEMAAGGWELPQVIISDILLRLPVTSLVRFRCVSKSWLSLITDPQFAQCHLKHHRDGNSTNKLQSRVILSQLGIPNFQSLGGGYREDAFREATALDYPLDQSVIIVGNCDGILCLVIDFVNIVLWNPCTRETRMLPLPPYQLSAPNIPYLHSGIEVFGFGYDALTDDYKIVRIPSLRCLEGLYRPGSSSHLCDLQVNVLTLKTNSWRRIQDVPHCLDRLQDPISAYGGLYWLVASNGKIGLILHFNFAEETFMEVALPPCNEFGENITTLAKWGGSPCVLRDYTLWVLGEGGAWTKLMTLPEISPPEYFSFFEPLCFTNSGKVFIAVDAEKFVLYDPKERTYEKLDICGKVKQWIHMTVFTESLISPGTGIVAELQG